MADILIIGGGIGGLSAGIALQQKGLAAHVFEAAPVIRAVGAGIWVPPNAMGVLQRLGLADAVRDAGLPLDRVEVRDLGGDVLQAIDGTTAASTFGHSTVSIRRSELQRILATALQPGTLHPGKDLVRYEDGGISVRARFSDGSESEGTFLVGADGLRSTVRRQLRPEVALRYSGQTCFRGLATLQLPAGLRRTAWEIWGGAARFGFSGVDEETVYWFAPIAAPAGSRAQGAELKAALLRSYEPFPDVVRQVIEATPTEAILQTDLHDFAPMRGWSAGRVVLLGDAAHATTPNLGQGGAQAIEDALSLALHFAARGPTPDALAEYEEVRRPRTTRIVRLSWQFGKMAHWENPMLRRVRNAVLRRTPTRVQQRQLQELFTARV
jgi:2-polyprenyl-6-methoxyphenol hydroxylase-like FAD-dependent oxidoreductase